MPSSATVGQITAAFVACLLLAGCAPEGFKNMDAWQTACIRQGGEPLVVKTSKGLNFLCIRADALIKVIP